MNNIKDDERYEQRKDGNVDKEWHNNIEQNQGCYVRHEFVFGGQ